MSGDQDDKQECAVITVRTIGDVTRELAKIAAAAQSTVAAIKLLIDVPHDPLNVLAILKFEKAGRHPVDGRDLNFIEQVNQTWSYVAALDAARLLLEWHPDCGGLHLAPGAHAAQDLDIMSIRPELIGAEVFAAVTPGNNDKFRKDRDKLAKRSERHRYVMFIAPTNPKTERCPKLERDGVEVWSISRSSAQPT